MAIPDHLTLSALCRVAKWYIFNPNIPIQADFGGHWNSQRCYILWPFVICIFNRLVCFMACLYVLRSFGNFSPILVCWTKKNLATLALCTYVRCWFLDGCLMDRRTVVHASLDQWRVENDGFATTTSDNKNLGCVQCDHIGRNFAFLGGKLLHQNMNKILGKSLSFLQIFYKTGIETLRQ
jgi:hypothetical protein